MISNKELKEALDNGWGDRIFHYYTQLVNANAVRPQNESSQEWNDILGTLRGIVAQETPKTAPTPKPKPVVTPKVETQDDEAGSIAD